MLIIVSNYIYVAIHNAQFTIATKIIAIFLEL